MEQLSPVLGHVFGDPRAMGVEAKGVEERGAWLLPMNTAWTMFRRDGREDMISVVRHGMLKGLGPLLYRA